MLLLQGTRYDRSKKTPGSQTSAVAAKVNRRQLPATRQREKNNNVLQWQREQRHPFLVSLDPNANTHLGTRWASFRPLTKRDGNQYFYRKPIFRDGKWARCLAKVCSFLWLHARVSTSLPKTAWLWSKSLQSRRCVWNWRFGDRAQSIRARRRAIFRLSCQMQLLANVRAVERGLIHMLSFPNKYGLVWKI